MTATHAMGPPADQPLKTPLYWRLLRLRNVHPNGWQRALLVEGVITLAVVLVLADIATAWTLLALPLAATVVVKAHDVLAGFLGLQSGNAPETPTAPPGSGDAAESSEQGS